MRSRRWRALTAAVACLAVLPGCPKLGLETDTVVVDDQRYLFIRPWVHYTVTGSGPPVVLIHGFPGDHHTWRNNVEGLAKYFEVFALDLPGFGRSVNPYGDYTVDFYSAHVATFIREMDLGPSIVIGHGTGGAVALDAFLRFPKRVQSVVLINSAGFDITGEALDEDVERMGLALHNYQEGDSLDRMIATVIDSPFKRLYTHERFLDEAERQAIIRNLETPGGRAAHLGALRTFRTSGVIERLMGKADELRLHSKSERRGERDILVIWGAQDPWFPPRLAEYFRSRIPGAKVAILKDAGHFAHVEQPDLVTGLIVDVMLPRPVADNRYSVANYDADYLIERGRTHKRRKDWKAALEAFNQALEKNPYLGLAYYELGDLLFQKQQFAESLEMLHRSLDIYPDNAAVHYRLGTTFHNQATELAVRLGKTGTDQETIDDITQGKMTKAVESYERAAALDPSVPNPWYNLGRIYARLERWKDAARAYGGLAAADPTKSRGHRLHVDMLVKACDLPAAAAALDGLAKVEKSNAEVRAMQGRIYRDLGRYDAAANSLQKASSLDPQNPRYSLDLAFVQVKLKKVEDATQTVDSVLERNPGDAAALLIRGALNFQKADWPAAISDYERVLRSSPDSVPAILGAAQGHLEVGAAAEADKLLRSITKEGAKGVPPAIYLAAARASARLVPEAPKKKAEKKLAASILARSIKLLSRAVDAGESPSGWGKDADFRRFKKDRRFKAVLKKKPGQREEPASDAADKAAPRCNVAK